MAKDKRLLIISLDGTPYSFLQQAMWHGWMPNFFKLALQADFRQMDSVLPPVSSAAWASFSTGAKPPQHGIWGFAVRNPHTMTWRTVNGNDIALPTLWHTLSQWGKKVFVMNVPMTCPPRPVNGILISGFLAEDVSRAAYPPEIGMLLKARGYYLDAQTELAHQNLARFYSHLITVLEKRVETFWHFWQQDRYDFAMLHVMETDRLNHFFWEHYQHNSEIFASWFKEFYQKIDEFIGKVLEKLSEEHALMVLSDHGFTTLKREVHLNTWLQRQGWLKYTVTNPQNLSHLHPDSRAYSLYPGRIYLNLKGRERIGSVTPGIAYERLREELKQQLLRLTTPEGQAVVKEVLFRENFTPHVQNEELSPPDLLVVPHEGYDFKGTLGNEQIFTRSVFNGTHTFADAFVLAHKITLPQGRLSIADLRNPILDFFR